MTSIPCNNGGGQAVAPCHTLVMRWAIAHLPHRSHEVGRSAPVTPVLELWVDVWVVLVAQALAVCVELTCILLKQVAGGEVKATPVPGLTRHLHTHTCRHTGGGGAHTHAGTQVVVGHTHMQAHRWWWGTHVQAHRW